jgi:hypothetical protein
METLGREADGWTERKAEAELRERLVRVERHRYRRPPPLTFAAFAERWVDEHADSRALKRSTRGLPGDRRAAPDSGAGLIEAGGGRCRPA